MAVKNDAKAVGNLYNNLVAICGKEQVLDAIYANLDTDKCCEVLNNVAKQFDIEVDSEGNISLN